jgi:hypothetical protein
VFTDIEDDEPSAAPPPFIYVRPYEQDIDLGIAKQELADIKTKFEDDQKVFGVCAHTAENTPADADETAVHLLPRFRTWVWGTWRDRWFDVAVPTWDRDYSSGNPSGYDWNLDLRVVPERDMRCVFPLASRSQNIGKFEGVHAQPGEFDATQDPSFREKRGKVSYRLVAP